MSHPSRVRGLKFFPIRKHSNPISVAPFAGAWIEILTAVHSLDYSIVAPFAGAWIEIFPFEVVIVIEKVAPFAGAWIEIFWYMDLGH